MGDCNACEEMDDSRFWRWDEVPIDEPPALDVAALASRRTEPSYGTPSAFPTPLIGMQTTGQAPDPAGIKAILEALQKSSFTDITGVAGTQANALAAYSKAMDTALAFGKEASTLAQQAAAQKNIGQTMRQIDKADADKKIDPDKAKQLRTEALGKLTGSDGALSPEEIQKRVKLVDELKAGSSITPDAAQALNKSVLRSLLSEGRSDQIVASDLAGDIPAESIASITTGGDGPTVIQTGLNQGRTAPTSIRGLSGLGDTTGEGSDTTTQLWEGGKSLLEAIADGIADWKDSPDKPLQDAVLASIQSALVDAADAATDEIPLVKALKVSVELSRVFAEAVGAALEQTNTRLRASYRPGELAGSGSEGLSDLDAVAIQDVRRWQLHSVEEVNGILEAGIEAVVEDVVKKAFTWLHGEAVKAVGSVAKQLVESYLKQNGVQALIASGLTELGRKVPKNRLNIYGDALTTVIGLYVRQLDNPTLRADLKPLAKMGTKKPMEKTLVTTLASLLVDPVVRRADASLRALIAEKAKALVDNLRASGQTVTGVPGSSVDGDANGVTLPSAALAEIETGPEAADVVSRREWE